MNPLQKAWLSVLEPLSYIVNEKMAKRSGQLTSLLVIWASCSLFLFPID